MEVNYKKFWEEIIAYFLSYDTDHMENDAPNNTYIVRYVFVAAVTFLPNSGLTTILDTHTDIQTDGSDLRNIPLSLASMP
jgi:hypothetical protein